jgi:putative transposase
VQRQRRDVHHTTALSLLNTYDTIYREDVRIRNMVRNHHLAKRISDAGRAAFRTILTSTAAYAGKWVVAVPAASTSQDGGGVMADGSRREPLCAAGRQTPVGPHPVRPFCGVVLERDLNAAQNMLWAGQARQAPTWPVGPSVA